MRPEERLAVIQRAVIREMAGLGQEFTLDGPLVRGPGTTAVAFRDHDEHGTGAGHVDLGYVLRLGQGDAPVLWDCAAGVGGTEVERLDSAVRMWAGTTATAVLSLLTGEGDHYDAPEFPGWHVVQGPAAVFGADTDPLFDWVTERDLGPVLAAAVLPKLTERQVNGVKLFFGGKAGDDVAEVRINGTVCEPASAALRALDWPRGERLCWARLFLLLVAEHPQPEHPGQAEPPPPRRWLGRWWRSRR
ncbi:hypothetical protein F4556_004808 [Kitasatospora gansuensis]|uniref:Uncharacterized protein n=1 Tax=Kitasatospora gansuensis TaxID=258050 RepID=A0A7W7WJK9_9ACTN|nr:DUF6348 family protein [Kitasatospora gansuensis]MBB4949273.1 hypothetical protein [Kitasatospora gansuensis]